jgi:uncharacterized protein
MSSLHRLAYAPAFAATLLVGCALDDAQPELYANIESSPRPYFELIEDSAGKFAFRFAGEDHATLLDSKWYESRQGALGGVVSVLDNGGLEQSYRIVETSSGDFGIELVAGNGVVIAESYLYTSRGAAQDGAGAIIAAIAEYLAHQHERQGARFDVYPDASGRYYFDVYAGDGSLVLSSQPYSSEAAALNGAFAARENSIRSERFRINEVSGGGYALELRARNGRTLATSPAFSSRAEAESGIGAMRELVPALPIL